MKLRAFAVVFSSLALVGAGCSPIVSPQIAAPISEAFTDRPIAQTNGFGSLPKIPTAQLKPGSKGSVRLLAEVPTVPAKVTVLRVNDGRPDENLLRNASDALDIPSGLLGDAPVGKNVIVTWNDAMGFSWNAAADGRRVDFSDDAHPVKTLTVSSLPTTGAATQLAITFLQDHGVSLKRFGTPYVDPDWSSWWDAQKKEGRCMDTRTLGVIRTFSATTTGNIVFPSLPSSGCVSAEFPSRMVVTFNATQDGQGIFGDGGMPRVGAQLIIDAGTQRVVSGFFTFGADPYRSDYAGLSQDEAEARLVRGGQGGTPNGDVTITTIRFEWYGIESRTTPPVRFLLPALVGDGTIEYADKTTAPYRIVVPLLKQ
ncbi:MAG: hypothetical protein ABIO72_04070 [Patescibacteria group bacterium]